MVDGISSRWRQARGGHSEAGGQRLKRKINVEGAALSEGAGHGHRAPMEFNDSLGKDKTQACS